MIDNGKWASWEDTTPQKHTLKVWRVDRFPHKGSKQEGVQAQCTVFVGWARHSFNLSFINNGTSWEAIGQPLSDAPPDTFNEVQNFWLKNVPLTVVAEDTFEFDAPVRLSLNVDPVYSDSRGMFGRMYLHLAYATVGSMVSLSPKGNLGFRKIKQVPYGQKNVENAKMAEKALKEAINRHLPEIKKYWNVEQ